MLSTKQAAQFKQILESRIVELQQMISSAQRETQAYAARQADPADQAASEYERQAALHKAIAARQRLKTLTEALKRLQERRYGQCEECGGEIERKRLEAIPWARYCRGCQEAQEQS